MKELSVEDIRLTRSLIERQGLWCADKRDDWEHAVIDSLLSHITSLERQLADSKREVVECVNNKNGILTVNILRSWAREDIVSFAKHLIGSSYNDELEMAARRILQDPYGCPMCRSGELINKDKHHWDNCGFKMLKDCML